MLRRSNSLDKAGNLYEGTFYKGQHMFMNGKVQYNNTEVIDVQFSMLTAFKHRNRPGKGNTWPGG